METKVFLGLRNVTSQERFLPGDLATADNLDIDDTGLVLTRLRTASLSGGSFHSLWADGDICLVVDAATNDLLRVNPDYTTTVLTRLSSGRRMSYRRIQDKVYLSNGIDKLRVEDGEVRPWGTPRPTGQPLATVDGGTLPPGTYQYAMTFRRADGQESGTGPAKSIVLNYYGGVRFSSLETSTDPEVRDRLIYVSGPDGAELFRVLEVPLSASEAVFRGPFDEATVRLETQFASPAPAGDLVELWNGTAYVVRANMAFYSDPYALERFRLRTQFLQFPGNVTMFSAVNDGIYVSTPEKTWFLSGDSPAALKSREIFDYGAIFGTAVTSATEDIKGEEVGGASGKAVLWTTPRGVCLGLDGGSAVNVTEQRFAFDSAQRGASIVRQARGFTQFLTTLEGSGSAGNSYS